MYIPSHPLIFFFFVIQYRFYPFLVLIKSYSASTSMGIVSYISNYEATTVCTISSALLNYARCYNVMHRLFT